MSRINTTQNGRMRGIVNNPSGLTGTTNLTKIGVKKNMPLPPAQSQLNKQQSGIKSQSHIDKLK